MGQDQLEMLSILCIESYILGTLNIDEIIEEFVSTKCRKKNF